MRRRLTRSATVLLVVAGMSLAAAPAWAHPHQIDTNQNGVIDEDDVTLANGQNHAPFVNGETCVTESETCDVDPAAYGLETAHHGPDAGGPGKADGKYQTTGRVPPGQDVENPVIG